MPAHRKGAANWRLGVPSKGFVFRIVLSICMVIFISPVVFPSFCKLMGFFFHFFSLFKPRLPFCLCCLVVRKKKILPRFVTKVLFSLSCRKSPMAKLCKERGGSKDLPLKSCLI